jgi:hypothetical protein
VLDAVGGVIRSRFVDYVAMMPLILRSSDGAQLLACIVSDEGVNVSRFELPRRRLSIRKCFWSKETHRTHFAVEDYFRSGCAAKDVAGQCVDTEHDARKKRGPSRIALEVVGCEPQVGPNDWRCILNHAVWLMTVSDAKLMLDTSGMSEVLTSPRHEGCVAVRPYRPRQAKEFKTQQKEKHDFQGGLLDRSVQYDKLGSFFHTNKDVGATC